MILTALFFFCNLLSLTVLAKKLKKTNEHKGLSLLNSFILGFGSMLYFLFNGYIGRLDELNEDKLRFYPIILYLHTFGVSYCLVDMWYNWEKIDLSGRIHHWIMAITLSIVIMFDLLKPAFLFFPIEISTVFLNMRSNFSKDTHLRDQATFFFGLTFIAGRLIYLPYVDYVVYLHFIKGLFLHIVYLFSVVPMQILQFYWFSFIIDKYLMKSKVKSF